MSSISEGEKVSLFFVGVGKCGTSWLFDFLRRYDLLSLPRIKEPYLIDCVPGKRAKEVRSLYQKPGSRADFSTLYYWDKLNAEKIKEYNPDAKIVITVRRPSSRVSSHFQFIKRNGDYASMTLEAYLNSGDPEQIVDRSDYDEMVHRYRGVFGAERVLILPLEQLKSDPQLYVDRLLSFCGEDPLTLNEDDFQPVLQRSSARSVVFAKVAKHTATALRRYRMLGLLQHLKDSSLIRGLLFREMKPEQRSKVSEGFGVMSDRIAELDRRYESMLANCYDD